MMMSSNAYPLGPARDKTRDQVTEEKIRKGAITYPVSVACVNFMSDSNLGFLVRSAACFGAEEVLVIGSIPSYRELRQLSCGTSSWMAIKQFKNPSEYLKYTRDNDIQVVSLELTPDSINIMDYEFPKNRRISILTGNESYGVPAEIIMNSDCLIIPNPGYGACMNTAQAANVALYEYVRQILKG